MNTMCPITICASGYCFDWELLTEQKSQIDDNTILVL